MFSVPVKFEKQAFGCRQRAARAVCAHPPALILGYSFEYISHFLLQRKKHTSVLVNMEKDKIVKRNVIFVHPDLGIGGAERLVIDAAVGLQSLGHKVTILTSHCDPKHCFEEVRDGKQSFRGLTCSSHAK